MSGFAAAGAQMQPKSALKSKFEPAEEQEEVAVFGGAKKPKAQAVSSAPPKKEAQPDAALGKTQEFTDIPEIKDADASNDQDQPKLSLASAAAPPK